MQHNLVIVESPAKAKTIEKFLGLGYKVLSSYGHIRDLKQKAFSIDVENNFKPIYEIPTDKKQVVSQLKTAAKEADVVWLASDEDREGEAISWHLYEVLGLAPESTRRIVFHEITKTAILKAIENPREIDVNLVNAQQARRILDRLVGFELSPVLWKRIRPSLSAGRVQSVAVRLIVERERAIHAFKTEAYYKVSAIFTNSEGTEIRAELNQRFNTIDEARAFLKTCESSTFHVNETTTKPVKKSPAPPFTTSTLQQEAARKLNFTVAKTMMLAQRLYENGFITYMRTDSVNLSDFALTTSREAIEKNMGSEYVQTRHYATHTKGAQEAHEAIRPTDMSNKKVEGTAHEQRLYELIWKRTIASQMADAELEKTTAIIGMDTTDMQFVASGEVITFDGFLKVYRESSDDEGDNDEEGRFLPPLQEGDSLVWKEINARERFTLPPYRFTEASLVHKLEELGIGRPSTYAPTISTIQNRKYVEKGTSEGTKREYNVLRLDTEGLIEETRSETVGNEKSKLIPTDIGTVVNDFLVENFPKIMDYNFTASVEKEFDEVAEGQTSWTGMIDRFYSDFHPLVQKTASEKGEHRVGERILGVDPVSGKSVSVKIGRFGPIAQIGTVDDEEKPRFSSLKKEQTLESITLEEALELFKLPRIVGDFEGKTVSIGEGRFGPYVRLENQYVSIPKEFDPITITLEEATELIRLKRNEEAKRIIKQFDDDPDVLILNGRYGPYITYKKKNYKIPDDVNPADLTLDACFKVITLQKTKSETRKRKK